MINYILDSDGNPQPCDDIIIRGRWFENADNRRVAKTEVPDGEVSTIFLGIDHAFGDGPPILWETMVFGGPLDGEQVRYTSRSGAVTGHEAMVARCVERKVAG